MLTEEIYTWIFFDENYILAGNDSVAHILDYEGNVKAEYADVGMGFRNGRLLVDDGWGVYLIEEETLTACTGYLKKLFGFECGQRTFWNKSGTYLIIWEGEQ